MNAAGIIRKLDNSLRKVTPLGRIAYKRIITRTGGDQLIGRPGTVTYTDTKLDPQPYYNRIGREHVPGGHTNAQTVVDSSGQANITDDWEFLLSPTAISESDLKNNDMLLVLKDSNGEETFRLLDYESPSGFGQDLAYIGYFRSIKRP